MREISFNRSDNGSPHQFYVRASALLTLVDSPSSQKDFLEAPPSVIVSSSIPRFLQGPRGALLTPTMCRNLAVLPVCETDQEHPDPLLRFLDFRNNASPPSTQDIPLTAITSLLDLGLLEKAERWSPMLVIRSWDGEDTIALSYTDIYRLQPMIAYTWLVKLDAGVMSLLDGRDRDARAEVVHD